MFKYYDQHIHSSYSRDSQEDIENYYKVALEKGVNYVITCEHFDYNTIVDGSTWDADYDDLIKRQEEFKVKYPTITSLLGCEIGYKLRAIEPINELLSKYNFDLVQLSFHDNDLIDYYFKGAFTENPEGKIIGYFTHIIEGLNRFDNFDVFSHLSFGFKTIKMLNPEENLKKYERFVKEIMTILIKKGKAFEINTKVIETIYSIDHNYDHLEYVLDLYKSLGGVKLTLSSDAHKTDRYMSSFDVVIPIIKKHGFNELSYFIQRKEYTYVLD